MFLTSNAANQNIHDSITSAENLGVNQINEEKEYEHGNLSSIPLESMEKEEYLNNLDKDVEPLPAKTTTSNVILF